MAGLRLGELVCAEDVRLPLTAETDEEVLAELADLALVRGLVSDAKVLRERLHEREALGSTAVGSAIAIPHAKVEGLAGVRLVIGVAPRGVPFGGKDGPTRLFFLVLSSPQAPSLHIRVLAQVSRVARAPGLVTRLAAACDAKALLEALAEFEGGTHGELARAQRPVDPGPRAPR